jgi:hypothetical protein
MHDVSEAGVFTLQLRLIVGRHVNHGRRFADG